MKPLTLAIALALLGAAGGLPAPVSAQDARPVIRTASEMPNRSYVLPLKPSAMISDAAAVRALADAMDRDAADTLAAYDIRDTSVRQKLLGIRMLAAAVRGDVAAADRFGRDATALEEKPALKLTGDLETTGLLATLDATTPEGRTAAYRAAVSAALADLPAGVVRPRVIEIRRAIDLTSPAYAEGQLRVYADPVWAEGRPMPEDFAGWVLGTAADMAIAWPYRPAYRAALTDWLQAHPEPEGADIWPARSVELSATDRLTPVGVAIWDVGVDRPVFSGSNEVAPTLAFDTTFRQTEGDLKPTPPELTDRLTTYERYMRGRGVLNQGLDGADADYARALIAGLTVEQIPDFEAGYRFYTGWIHGTHVAGIAAKGDPAIRVVPVRITFDDAAIPPPVDEGLAANLLASARASIAHMKANGVRVANMSWGMTGENIEQSLAANNIEDDPERRTARAQAIFNTLFDGMSALMAEAPEILFVIAAGNSDEDLDFVRDMPGSINLPNVLSVGAVDETGALTSFASTGASVDLYAPGYNIESFVPGGGRVVWSGASLSAPQVVNAAAKMLTLNPELTTAEVVAILTETSDLSAEGVALLNERAAVDRVRRARDGE